MVFDKRGGKKADSCDPMDQLNPTHSVTLRTYESSHFFTGLMQCVVGVERKRMK